MVTILLIIIYIAFISLGLPDSILGTALPAMQNEWGFEIGMGGLFSFVTVGSTVLSSFMSGYIIKKVDTGKIVFVSCLLTGLALLGFSLSNSYYWLFLFAIPLGLGAGAIDTSLNNFVALHFKAHHMNWLHCFWGVGATLGPIIMSVNMSNYSWRDGYGTISKIQLSLAAIMLLSLPLWKKVLEHKNSSYNNEKSILNPSRNPFRIKGVIITIITMFVYCAIELGCGLWGSSFLVNVKELSADSAALWMALYYGGITAGRFLAGFISFKLNNSQMIRFGAIIATLGIILIVIPLPVFFIGCSFVLIGMGLAPIFPAMIHETPKRFGKENSEKIIGFQMGFAYIGHAIMPSVMGFIFQYLSITLFPIIMLSLAIIMFVTTERVAEVARK